MRALVRQDRLDFRKFHGHSLVESASEAFMPGSGVVDCSRSCLLAMLEKAVGKLMSGASKMDGLVL